MIGNVAGLADTALDLAAPLLDPLANVPVLGGLLDAVTDTAGNLVGFVGETADTVSNLDPLELIGNVLDNPLGAVGSTVQDVSGTVDALLEDLAPITNAVESLPLVGGVAAVAGDAAAALNQGLYDAGTVLQSINLDLLNVQTAYV